MFVTGVNGVAQQRTPLPQDYLQRVQSPAIDIAEAIARCSAGEDTSMQNMLKQLSAFADKDTIDLESVSNRHRTIHQKFLAKLRQQLEQEIQEAGETIDKAIQECPTVADSQGRQVYDPRCVEAAEHRGHQRRIAVVEDYLSRVQQTWIEYKTEVAKALAATQTGKWQLVLRVAVDAATITQSAAQFAR